MNEARQIPLQTRGAFDYISGFRGLIIIVAGAVALRLINLGSQGLWQDEAASTWFASLTLSQLFASLAHESNPPLFYLALKLWLMLGRSDLWVRLLPVLLGAIGVILVYLSALEVWGKKRAALAAAGLAALSSFLLHYSQEVRGYILWFDFHCLAFLFLWRWLKLAKRAYLLAYTGAAALAFYSHYAAGFHLIALCLLGFWGSRDKRKYWWDLAGAHLFLLLLILPLLPAFWSQAVAVSSDFWIAPLTIWEAIRALGHLVVAIPGVAESGILVAGILFYFMHRDKVCRMLWFTALLPFILLVISSLAIKPVLIPRLLLPSLLSGCIIGGGLVMPLAWPHRRARRIFLAALLCFSLFCSGLYFVLPGKGGKINEKWRTVSKIILSQGDAGDAIVFVPPWAQFAFDWYQRQAGGPAISKYGLPHTVSPTLGPFRGQPRNLAASLPGLRKIISEHNRVWLLTSRLKDPEGLVPAYFTGRGVLLEKWRFTKIRLYLYQSTGAPWHDTQPK